jgi:hypothetical protein
MPNMLTYEMNYILLFDYKLKLLKYDINNTRSVKLDVSATHK